MTTLPFLRLVGKSSLVYVVRLQNGQGLLMDFWEIDSSISPALIILLIYGVWAILVHKPHFDKRDLIKKAIAGICLIISVIFVFQFSTARGFLFDAVKGWPFIKSLRTNTRFIASCGAISKMNRAAVVSKRYRTIIGGCGSIFYVRRETD